MVLDDHIKLYVSFLSKRAGSFSPLKYGITEVKQYIKNVLDTLKQLNRNDYRDSLQYIHQRLLDEILSADPRHSQKRIKLLRCIHLHMPSSIRMCTIHRLDTSSTDHQPRFFC